jgi:plasmid stabilization system protein ParE
MAIEIIFLADAERDVDEAYAWYEKFRNGLGEEFLNCLDARIESIRNAPESHAIVHRDFRRALVRRFPYAIFYEHVESTILIYGVFHTSRDAGKWQPCLT